MIVLLGPGPAEGFIRYSRDYSSRRVNNLNNLQGLQEVAQVLVKHLLLYQASRAVW